MKSWVHDHIAIMPVSEGERDGVVRQTLLRMLTFDPAQLWNRLTRLSLSLLIVTIQIAFICGVGRTLLDIPLMFQSALDVVSRNRTTLVIAHRLSTVINADEIIVLKDGVIAERGTHGELIDRDGLYASMWSRQRVVQEAVQKLREAGGGEDKRFIPKGDISATVPAE